MGLVGGSSLVERRLSPLSGAGPGFTAGSRGPVLFCPVWGGGGLVGGGHTVGVLRPQVRLSGRSAPAGLWGLVLVPASSCWPGVGWWGVVGFGVWFFHSGREHLCGNFVCAAPVEGGGVGVLLHCLLL